MKVKIIFIYMPILFLILNANLAYSCGSYRADGGFNPDGNELGYDNNFTTAKSIRLRVSKYSPSYNIDFYFYKINVQVKDKRGNRLPARFFNVRIRKEGVSGEGDTYNLADIESRIRTNGRWPLLFLSDVNSKFVDISIVSRLSLGMLSYGEQTVDFSFSFYCDDTED